jgi:hypothetical protein
MGRTITSSSVATLNSHFKNSTIVFSTVSVTTIMAQVLFTFNPIIKFFKELYTNY